MTIKEFLSLHIIDLQSIVNDLPKEISSHDFIEKFAKKIESEYIDMLVHYKGNNAFQSVHSQIARFVSEHSGKLGVTKIPRNPSENIFGDIDIIQWWKKN